MVHAEHHVVVNRPLEVVYGFLADGLNNPKWRAGIVDISLRQGPAGAVGAIYRQVLKGPGGRPIDGDYRITKAEPNKELRFVVVAGPARPEGRYTLEPVTATTKVTFVLDYQPRGLQRLLVPLIAKTMRAEVANLAALKHVLETGEAATRT